MNVNIAWSTTNYGPLWAPVYTSHLRAVAKASRHFTVNEIGSITGVGCTDRMYVHSASNQLVEDFLGIDGATHLFMTECDMILPDDTLQMLVEVDKPIVSGVYFLRNSNGQPCLYRKPFRVPDNPYPYTPVTVFPTEEPFKLNGCPGMGCVLFKREVFEKMPRPWFDVAEQRYGQDVFFFTHAEQQGIDVWVHPQVRCGQIDYTVVGWDDYVERIENDPVFAANGYIIGAEAAAD